MYQSMIDVTETYKMSAENLKSNLYVKQRKQKKEIEARANIGRPKIIPKVFYNYKMLHY